MWVIGLSWLWRVVAKSRCTGVSCSYLEPRTATLRDDVTMERAIVVRVVSVSWVFGYYDVRKKQNGIWTKHAFLFKKCWFYPNFCPNITNWLISPREKRKLRKILCLLCWNDQQMTDSKKTHRCVSGKIIHKTSSTTWMQNNFLHLSESHFILVHNLWKTIEFQGK